MQGGEELSIEELFSNLSTYKEQLQQVRELLVHDPGNSEYADMEKELSENEKRIVGAICESLESQQDAHHFYLGSFAGGAMCGDDQSASLSPDFRCHNEILKELLATAKQNAISVSETGTSASASPNLLQSKENKTESGSISDNQEKLAVGTKVQAVYSEDGEWYDATIEAITPNGYYVTYDSWGNKEEVDPANVRPVNLLVEAEKVAEATKLAIKRKIEQAAASDFQSKSLPAKLHINPDDPEDVVGGFQQSFIIYVFRQFPAFLFSNMLPKLLDKMEPMAFAKAAKRKKIHAFKSKMRFEQLEVTQNKRQNAWQQFQTTKGKTKKVGFFSGRKRESIFKSPDDPYGKVGVTGSGKGLTDFQKREKHLHLKGGGIADTDD
ncbi:Tudor domain-containing protein [Citrus sinensis]|uniref:Tudor domain-containing protein n=1 Tax=Citrus sinensis TaxID=2711 RepID=A0ACB8K714_CITSI|nr:Tudor domain-containing protein [Citrus sinensis]